MKKKIIILLLGLFIIYLPSCTYKEDKLSPVVSVRVVPYLEENYLEWSIKNYDEKDSLVFLDGNIMNYSIRQLSTQKLFSNEHSKSKDKYTLKPQDVYSEKVRLDDITDKGEYEATFWATTKENIKYQTIFIFKKK